MLRKDVFRIVVATLVFLAAWALVFTRAFGIAGPRWGANYFPNVPLTTQNGKTVHFYDDLLKDKIVAIDLIYTHCVDSCPLETARLAQVQKLLGDRVGKDIFFYSISIDPKRDTPAVLKEYAEKYHAGPGWLFLTGKPSDIDLISKKLGLYSDPDSGNRDGHTTQLLVGNVATGQWVQDSAVDNPRYLATTLSNFIDGFRKPSPEGQKTYAAAAPIHADSGQYLFATRCAACHTLGHGVRIGPDLLGITKVRDHAWLARMIQRPDEMLAQKDPLALLLFRKYNRVQMPNLRLGPQDTEKVINFLQNYPAAPDGRSGSEAGANTARN
jgi:protein SCO1/2